jgi:hypothetical protein
MTPHGSGNRRVTDFIKVHNIFCIDSKCQILLHLYEAVAILFLTKITLRGLYEPY